MNISERISGGPMNDEAKQKILRVAGTIVILVLVIGGVYFLAKKDSANRTAENSASPTEESAKLTIRNDDWILGNKNAKVAIIEYSDFQCPACAFAATSLKEVHEAYPSEVVIAYRHFPLNYHQFALEAAIATEIAGESGKFWEMNEMLFANQEKLSHHEILNIAESLGFNRLEFDKKMLEKKYKDAVYKDQLEGQDLKLDHTPSIFINGADYAGNIDKDSIISEIKKYL